MTLIKLAYVSNTVCFGLLLGRGPDHAWIFGLSPWWGLLFNLLFGVIPVFRGLKTGNRP